MRYTAENINERNAESLIVNHWRHISRDTRNYSNCSEWEMENAGHFSNMTAVVHDGGDDVDICSSLRYENSGMERCTFQETLPKA